MKEKLINYFFEAEEYEILRPYLKTTGSILLISFVVSILFMIGV